MNLLLLNRRVDHWWGRQLTQQLNPAELDNASIVRGEQPSSQQAVNGFAGADETCGFFPHRVNHDGTPYAEKDKEYERWVKLATAYLVRRRAAVCHLGNTPRRDNLDVCAASIGSTEHSVFTAILLLLFG